MGNFHDDKFDLRLDRRLKRRSISNHSDKKNILKKTFIEKRRGNGVIELVEPEKNVGHGEYGNACGFDTVTNAVTDDNYEDHGYTMFRKYDVNSSTLVVHGERGAVKNLASNQKTMLERILKQVSGGVKEGVSVGSGDVPSQRAVGSQTRSEKKWVMESSGIVPFVRKQSLAVRKASGKTRVGSKMRSGSERDCPVKSSVLCGEKDVLSQRALRSQTRNEKKRILESSGIVPFITQESLAARKANGKGRAVSKMRVDSVRDCPVEPSMLCGEGDVLLQRASRFHGRGDKKRILKDSGTVPIATQKSFAVRKSSNKRRAGSRERLGSVRGLSVESDSDFVDEEYARLVRDCDHCDVCENHDVTNVKLVNLLAGGDTREKSNPGPTSYGNHFVERDVGENSNGFAEDEYSDGSEDDDVCEDYLAFLDFLEMEREDLSDKAADSESDSDLVVLGENLHGKPPLPIIDLDEDNPSNYPDARCSEFKRELLEVLKMPYDSNQHQELKEEVNCRRPITEVRDLRGKSVTYPSKTKLGKSYIAIYPEFARLFDLAKNDKHRSLNLLRGFFFWLKNITRDGAFTPWQYPSMF